MSKISKIASAIFEKEAASKRFNLGPGVVCTLKTTKDQKGYEISLSGTFQSGKDIQQTANDIQKAWDEISID